MTDEQNKEVKAQVQFKMEQFRDWLENSSNWDKQEEQKEQRELLQKISAPWSAAELQEIIEYENLE